MNKKAAGNVHRTEELSSISTHLNAIMCLNVINGTASCCQMHQEMTVDVLDVLLKVLM